MGPRTPFGDLPSNSPHILKYIPYVFQASPYIATRHDTTRPPVPHHPDNRVSPPVPMAMYPGPTLSATGDLPSRRHLSRRRPPRLPSRRTLPRRHTPLGDTPFGEFPRRHPLGHPPRRPPPLRFKTSGPWILLPWY